MNPNIQRLVQGLMIRVEDSCRANILSRELKQMDTTENFGPAYVSRYASTSTDLCWLLLYMKEAVKSMISAAKQQSWDQQMAPSSVSLVQGYRSGNQIVNELVD